MKSLATRRATAGGALSVGTVLLMFSLSPTSVSAQEGTESGDSCSAESVAEAAADQDLAKAKKAIAAADKAKVAADAAKVAAGEDAELKAGELAAAVQVAENTIQPEGADAESVIDEAEQAVADTKLAVQEAEAKLAAATTKASAATTALEEATKAQKKATAAAQQCAAQVAKAQTAARSTTPKKNVAGTAPGASAASSDDTAGSSNVTEGQEISGSSGLIPDFLDLTTPDPSDNANDDPPDPVLPIPDFPSDPENPEQTEPEQDLEPEAGPQPQPEDSKPSEGPKAPDLNDPSGNKDDGLSGAGPRSGQPQGSTQAGGELGGTVIPQGAQQTVPTSSQKGVLPNTGVSDSTNLVAISGLTFVVVGAVLLRRSTSYTPRHRLS